MHTDASADQPLPTAEPVAQPQPPAAPRGQRPWHQPQLTQVALQVTGQGSGGGDDGSTPATTGT